MPKNKSGLLAAIILLLQAPLSAAEIFVVNSASRTLSRIDTQAGTVNNSFTQLGLTPNLMDLDEDHVYIACSGDNAIQVVNRATGAHIRYIPVAPSSNPYDVLRVGENLYVTGLFTDKVYKISLQSNSVVASLTVGISPQGLANWQNRLFVCNTGGYINNYANSSISVIDLDSFTLTETLPVWTNPQFAVVHDGYLHVSCTGNWTDIQGKVDIIDPATLELVQRLNIGGNPGNIWINPSGLAYLGDGMGFGLYSYDAVTHEVYHNASNPLPYDAFAISGNAGMMALLDQNWTGNSVVTTYQHDLIPLNSYNVGLSSTDMVVTPEGNTANNDQVQKVVFRLYPNPLPRGGSLRLVSGRSGNAELRIYNPRGQLLQKESVSPDGTVPLPKLPAGVYLYRVEQDQHIQSGKLLILN
ncbi:MAG: T9SS type A sorting domain-containing protein [Candidatus Syntrophosphaera sp.]|nr:T9SS type A sorting domain-containing protein [Candidatus Syntrophosphaera sp.]